MTTYQPDAPELQELWKNVRTQFDLSMTDAYNSAALTGDETPVEVARCVLVLVAEKFAPLSPHNRRLLANLRHFV